MTDTRNILVGDCVDVMRGFAEGSIDAIVTDPPYGLGFMGKAWDDLPPGPEFAAEALRVLKPGGHLLAFGGTRTFHRLVVALEDAGFEIRDTIAWLYGSGFPKSKNLDGDWKGWGTALKPAHEPIVVARKSLIGTVAANVLEYGTGAINVDGCRVGTEGGDTQGRWPANVVLDEEAAAMLDEQSGTLKSGSRKPGAYTSGGVNAFGEYAANERPEIVGDLGGASRFFYCAKPSRKERDAGLDGAVEYEHSGPRGHTLNGDGTPRPRPRPRPRANVHPTVKPVALMRWLVRMVTPPGGTVLDPFLGSGTTGVAAALERVNFVGIEREPEYVEIARARIAFAYWDSAE